MTPLIDVVFLLLIFFMLSTNFVNQRAINLEVPSKNTNKNSWQGAIIIRPDKNSVLINSKRVSFEQSATTLLTIINATGTGIIPKIIIQPYKNIPLQTTVRILDQVRDAGASLITLIK